MFETAGLCWALNTDSDQRGLPQIYKKSGKTSCLDSLKDGCKTLERIHSYSFTFKLVNTFKTRDTNSLQKRGARVRKNILWDFLVSNVSDILSIYNLTFLIYFLYDWGISHFSNVFKYENLFKKSLENLKVGIGVIYLTNLTARASTPQSLHLEFHCRLLGLFLMKTQEQSGMKQKPLQALCGSVAQGVVILRINGDICSRKGFTFEART